MFIIDRTKTPPAGWVIDGYWGGDFNNLVNAWRRDNPQYSESQAQDFVENALCERLKSAGYEGWCVNNRGDQYTPKNVVQAYQCNKCGR